MTEKPGPTRTTGPLHFEDLEPHRFEDLVRRLIYDFRPWRQLEAAGRSGGDGAAQQGSSADSTPIAIIGGPGDTSGQGAACRRRTDPVLSCT